MGIIPRQLVVDKLKINRMKTLNRILGSALTISLFAVASLTVKAAVTAGSLATWGSGITYTNVEPNYGQATIPVGLAGVTIDISSGVYHSVALKTDGTVVAWGDNTYGQVTGTPSANPTPNLPPLVPNPTTASPVLIAGVPLAGVTAIAAGGLHTLALKSFNSSNDPSVYNSVVAWGYNTQGQTTIPLGLTTVTVPVSVPRNGDGSVNYVTLAAQDTRIVVGMPVTGTGLSIGTVGAGAKVVSVATAAPWNVTLSVPNTNTNAVTSNLTFGANVKSIAAGYYHSVALKNDGTVVAWGDNSASQTTIPASLAPIQGTADIPISPVSLAATLSATNTVTLTAGANAGIINGMFVTGGTVGPNARVSSVSGATVTLTVNNTAASSATLTFTAGTVTLTSGNPVNASIVSGMLVTAAPGTPTVNTAGAIITGKAGNTLTLSAPNSSNNNAAVITGAPLTFSVVGAAPVTAIAAGNEHTVVLKEDGAVSAWGRNVETQTTIPAGLATVSANAILPGVPITAACSLPANPTPPGTIKTVTLLAPDSRIVAGMFVTGPAGTVAPGSKILSIAGQVLTLTLNNANIAAVASANLTFAASTVPNNAVTISAINNNIVPGMLVSGVGIASGTTVVSKDITGLIVTLLDNNTYAGTNNSAVTTLVFSPSTKVIAIAAGGDTTYALKADTHVAAWGDNFNGQVSLPTSANASANPILIGGLTGVTAIAAGGDHALALKTDTTVAAWGKIWAGVPLGYVTETIPAGLTGVRAISAGAFHSLSIIAGPLVINTHPVSAVVIQGSTHTFSVIAPGATSYQWLRNGAVIAGATNSTLTLTNIQSSDVGGYSVVCSNSVGSVTSNVAQLTGIFTPVITSQPTSYVAMQPGVTVTYYVKATGGALTFQWQRNGVNITSGTVTNTPPLVVTDPATSVLTLTNVQTSDVGGYSVIITNAAGSVTSVVASLQVIPQPPLPPPTGLKPAIISSLAPIFLNKGVLMAPTYQIVANTYSPIVYSATNLPPGLRVNATTGVISGRPTRLGTYLVTMTAKSRSAGPAVANKYFTVNP